MREVFLAATAVIAIAAASATAQPFTGDFILGGQFYSQSDGLVRVDRQGNATTMATGMLPGTSSYVWEVIQAEDNRDFYVLLQDTTADAILRVDAQGSVVQTVWSDANTLTGNPVNLHLDQNGRLRLLYTNGSSSELYQIDPASGQLATVTTMPIGDSFYGAAARDIDTGDDLVWVNNVVFRVDRIFGTVTTAATNAARIARMGFAQDTITGNAYGGTCCSDTLYHMDLQTGATSLFVGPIGLYGSYGLKFERRVAATTNLMFIANNGFSSSAVRNQITGIDTAGVITTIYTGVQAGTGQIAPYSLEIEGTNEIQPLLVLAPNDRQVALSFPTGAGLQYVCAINVTGIRPGFVLPDGRRVNFNLDQIALATLNGAFDFLITNRVGTLAANGRAVVGLNWNALGRAVAGVPLTLQVVVFDPQAPLGIAIVSEPYTIRLE